MKTAGSLTNRNLVNQTLIPGLSLLAVLLALTFFITGRSVEAIVNRATNCSAQIQARSMSLALQQILMETRNQLLILAAGPMSPEEMRRRLFFRSKVSNLFYREVAFMGISPENRYLLLNNGQEVIAVPPQIALDAPNGPFHTINSDQRPGHVKIGQPMEINYAMVPIGETLRDMTFYVLRFSTPVYDATGQFQGILVLSLDLQALRNAMSLFASPPLSSPDASSDGGEENQTRSLFFDRDGWMLFQSEIGAEATRPQEPLSSDAVRMGFHGDFGRPGFKTAFRPAPEHIEYWKMVAEVQAGHSGQTTMPPAPRGGGAVWASGDSVVIYAPVTFKAEPNASPVIVGGLAMRDNYFSSTRTGIQILGLYTLFFLAGLLLLGLCLWWLAHNVSRRLNKLASEIRDRNEQDSDTPLSLPPLPRELERIKRNVNVLLGRLQRARTEQLRRAEQKIFQWQREPVEDFPQSAGTVHSLVGQSPPMQALQAQIQKAAAVLANVLVVGETGTGKELVSQSIHRLSDRADGPFISINCGALEESLLMDTLFGHVKGAFTEARQARKGAFLAAEGGTLMLDEVGNAAPKVQQALLRALSTRHIRPLGADHDIPFNTRIIAATNADLRSDSTEGAFRTDLYYRLAVITINTPPLRQRKEDIPLLVAHFMAEAVNDHAPGMPRTVPKISRGALEKIMCYHWPGNVRELKNTLIQTLTFYHGDVLLAEHIQLDHDETHGLLPPSEASCPWPPAPRENENEQRDPLPLAALQPAGQKASSDPTEIWSQPPVQTRPEPDGQSTPKLAQLNPRQRALLLHLQTVDSVSRHEYQALADTNISVRTAQYDLQHLVRLGILHTEGRGPALRYVLTAADDTLPPKQPGTKGNSPCAS